jgi:hypothetical protein
MRSIIEVSLSLLVSAFRLRCRIGHGRNDWLLQYFTEYCKLLALSIP